jgi:hypothetical protein
MATQTALNLRRNEAYERISRAVRKLAKGKSAASKAAALDARHRDPQIEQLQRLEAIADTLDALAKEADKVSAEDEKSAAKGKAKS